MLQIGELSLNKKQYELWSKMISSKPIYKEKGNVRDTKAKKPSRKNLLGKR